MIQQVLTALKRFWEWLRRWFWDKPTSKPIPEKPIRVKAEEIIDEFVVIKYHDQRINLRRMDIPRWNRMNRNQRRAMSNYFKKLEKRGLVRFEVINGRLTCVKNKDYQALADMAKEQKNGQESNLQ